MTVDELVQSDHDQITDDSSAIQSELFSSKVKQLAEGDYSDETH